ncbi:IclR family transcriptional regulator [Shinella sumterensis]|uniref:IclR family transcriptional regulator n=1 Tax=Shinella sumterensis TaxID=1967501 RepID=A0AA50HAL8_9HYPH|nr:IclR family transcriptional regulator [Shinella sumterensis]WLS00115.1 IclR family transcriptional regulator [Shinella sumterensis]
MRAGTSEQNQFDGPRQIHYFDYVQYTEQRRRMDVSGRGVERVLDMIEWFAASPEGASLSEIAAALAMPKSSALLMLQSLTERGYIHRLGSGEYQLLRLPGEISPDGRNYGALIALVSPYLADAVQQTGETGFVAVLEGPSIRYLNKVLPKREILYDRDIGPTRPAHKVASGVVLLAAGSDAEIEAYAVSASLSEAERSKLLNAVESARKSGFYVNPMGIVEGAAGAAAPIMGANGKAIAALNISGPQVRFVKNSDRISEVVRETAVTISEELARRSRRLSKGR